MSETTLQKVEVEVQKLTAELESLERAQVCIVQVDMCTLRGFGGVCAAGTLYSLPAIVVVQHCGTVSTNAAEILVGSSARWAMYGSAADSGSGIICGGAVFREDGCPKAGTPTRSCAASLSALVSDALQRTSNGLVRG